MERNWLIRTSQNQILGPVAKEKLLEFLKKGALGLTDEVASGNGYWFSLKEKDLVEKYLYGDVPQSYNPISESMSVLATRENPEKTTSINTAPANQTQVIKLSSIPGLAPKAEDLEMPDVTLVAPKPSLNLNDSGSVILPDASDLEFPDVSKITSAVQSSFVAPVESSHAPASTMAQSKSIPVSEIASDEKIILPSEDDLAFPDLETHKTSVKVGKGEVDLSVQHTRTVALDNKQKEIAFNMEDNDIQFSLDLEVVKPVPVVAESTNEVQQKVSTPLKKERVLAEDRKLLFERKVKSSVKPAAIQRDPNREVAYQEVEPLKKRNDNYLFFILIILVFIIIAVFFYFKEILNKPLPV